MNRPWNEDSVESQGIVLRGGWVRVGCAEHTSNHETSLMDKPKGVVLQDFNKLNRPYSALDVCSDGLQEVIVVIVIVHKQPVCPIPRRDTAAASEQNHPTAGGATIIGSSLNKVEFLEGERTRPRLRI